MDIRRVTASLSALATPSRLEVLRVLAQAGSEGMPSGDIAKALDVPQNTLSTQLSILASAQLVESHRQGRFIIYRVDADALRELVEFMTSELGAGGKGKGGKSPRRAAA